MVRNQRFVLALLLISSIAFTGCANTRSRFASLWRRGADDSFSESIVDNRKMPKSAREMADGVQDSLRDSADELDESTESLADSTKSKSGELSEKRKRYSESTDKRIDELDNRIDDVVAQAKARNAASNPKPRVRSDFPEDPFLSEFDALAEKSPVQSDEDGDPVLERLAGAKQKLAASLDPFSDDKDVAEPLIAKVEKTAEQTVNDAFDDANPFESLATTDGANDSPNPTAEQPEPEKTPTRTTKEAVAANKEVHVDELANEFPDLEFPVADDEPAVAARVAEVVADDADDFDLMFAEAKPVVEKAKQTIQENSFRTASARQDKSDSETNVFGGTSPAKNASVPRELKDEFDRMIVDSDELPQKTALLPQRSTNVTPDEFTGANQQLDTYDDFFEADHSVRANEPGDATQRGSNPFSFAEPVRETNTVPAVLTPPTTVPEPVDPPKSDLVSPFENLDEIEEPDEVELPVAATEPVSPFDSANKFPTNTVELVAQPAAPPSLTVIPASGNSATANGASELNAFDRDPVTGPEFEFADADSEPELVTHAELPEIVPGDAANSAFSNEPYVDLSAVTQTPLENVAWEVEPDTSAVPGAGRTSPWIAWIAVALCSIALILLLRPATNRIS